MSARITSEEGPDTTTIRVEGRLRATEGTSCLFLMTAGATQDKVVEAMKQRDFEIVSTNLSKENEEALREAFGE